MSKLDTMTEKELEKLLISISFKPEEIHSIDSLLKLTSKKIRSLYSFTGTVKLLMDAPIGETDSPLKEGEVQKVTQNALKTVMDEAFEIGIKVHQASELLTAKTEKTHLNN